ncbi:MAG: hypothetical protein QNJ75_09290 [Acidimicrobiia bacterium]|nr:hypothetical protein [Acidimicrobiia bacterium]
MLSWSCKETNQKVDLLPIASGTGDPLLPGGEALIGMVNATLAGSGVADARDKVVAALGGEAAVDAAAVIGNFEMMNRIADGVGMPVGAGSRKRMADVIELLGLDQYPHA